jgi:DNA-binding transcriptional regulator LsrR (DeoR family)
VITLTNFGYNSREISEDLNLPNCRINRLIQEAKSKNLIKKMV